MTESVPQRQRQCSQPSCDRGAYSTGLCAAHYQRKRIGIDMDRPITRYRSSGVNSGPCGVTGCDGMAVARGLCRLHYGRLRRHGDPLNMGKRGRPPVITELPQETSPARLGRMLGVSRQRAHQLLNMPAHRARGAVNRALQSGKLIKPSSCERCNKRTSRLEAHHWDYREELDVRWLCSPCHSIVHPHHPTVHGKSNLAEQGA